MKTVFNIKDLSLYYGSQLTLKDINLKVKEKNILLIIGPSGGGKSSLLRTLNRMNDNISGFNIEGNVLYNDENIYTNGTKVNLLRQEVGMVFQKPCIFPKSIYDNVLFGVEHLGINKKSDFSEIVEKMLKTVSLWREVKDKLHHSALELSQGQQQRLAIARALAVRPKVLLMDEPTSSLDPKSTEAIEELVMKLKIELTVVMVTHKLEQAKKLADYVVFICDGKIIEQGSNKEIFSYPHHRETKDYLKWDACKC